VVSDNTMYCANDTVRGVLLNGRSCERNLIDGNTIHDPATYGVSATSTSDQVTVSNNHIYCPNGADGVRLTNCSKNNVVRNNTILSSGQGGVTIDTGAGVVISGNVINDATNYGVRIITASEDTFLDAAVNTTTDRITITDHNHWNADEVTLTSTGTLPAGLALATTYYIKNIDDDTIEFYSDSGLSSIVDITAAAGGGTHTILRTAVNIVVRDNTIRDAGTLVFANLGDQVLTTGSMVQNNFGEVAQTFTSADATPSVLIGSNFLSNATGVTITRFDDGYATQEISIVSKGATVYDTSTASRLIGSSVDITTASGDVTTWVCETGGTTSSVWRLKGFVDVSADNSAGA